MATDAAYARSVLRALRSHGGLAPLAAHLRALPEKVSGLVPYDVVALSSVQVADRAWQDDRAMVAAHTLALRGYDADTAFAIWHGFRENFPDFTPEVAMLMSKDALHEKYGHVNGDLIAGMLLDPGGQPILHALLLGDVARNAVDGLVTVVERSCVSVQFRCTADSTLLFRVAPETSPSYTNWQIGDEPVKILDPYTAAHAYAQATDGGRLPSKVAVHISPEELYARGRR